MADEQVVESPTPNSATTPTEPTVETATTPDPMDEFDADFDIAPVVDTEDQKPQSPQSNDTEDTVLPEDRTAIEKVSKRIISDELSPAIKVVKEHEMKLDQVYAKNYVNEEYEGYTKDQKQKIVNKILDFKKSSRYSNLSVEEIGALVGAKHQQRLGAQKERAAQKRAAESSTPGSSSPRTVPTGKNWMNATPAELEAERARIFNQ